MTNFSVIWIDEAKCPFCGERFPTRPLEISEYNCPRCGAKAEYSSFKVQRERKDCTVGNKDCVTEIREVLGEVLLTWTRK